MQVKGPFTILSEEGTDDGSGWGGLNDGGGLMVSKEMSVQVHLRACDGDRGPGPHLSLTILGSLVSPGQGVIKVSDLTGSGACELSQGNGPTLLLRSYVPYPSGWMRGSLAQGED